jgi:hypothetical protein
MLQFTVVTRRETDGISAAVPSIRECESWAANEEDALTAMLERVAFFLGREPGFRHVLDIMRRENGTTWYNLIVRDP